MAYTESKAYDLQRVQYKGTRIGGKGQITTSPVQYQGTPVPYVKYKNTNIMHCYTVWNGNGYKVYYSDESDFDENILAGKYSVSSTYKTRKVLTDIPFSDTNQKILYQYHITKWELTRTSGDKNESKYYLYAFTIVLKSYWYDKYDPNIHIDTNKYRTDKYDYLSTEDISLDTLAAQIEDPSGSYEGFTPPWKLDIPLADILKNTRRERVRIDNLEYTGNFNYFSNGCTVESEGEPSSWGDEIDNTYDGIFNQGGEGLIVYHYPSSSSSSPAPEFSNGAIFNFDKVVNSKSQVDSDHVCITGYNCDHMHSSCWIDTGMDDRRSIYITEGHGRYISSDNFDHFPLIFLICSSCSNLALSEGDNIMELNYYTEYFTQLDANATYNNYIKTRDY